jgi:hypothetical protein
MPPKGRTGRSGKPGKKKPTPQHKNPTASNAGSRATKGINAATGVRKYLANPLCYIRCMINARRCTQTAVRPVDAAPLLTGRPKRSTSVGKDSGTTESSATPVKEKKEEAAITPTKSPAMSRKKVVTTAPAGKAGPSIKPVEKDEAASGGGTTEPELKAGVPPSPPTPVGSTARKRAGSSSQTPPAKVGPHRPMHPVSQTDGGTHARPRHVKRAEGSTQCNTRPRLHQSPWMRPC